jgi:hypothetical protein
MPSQSSQTSQTRTDSVTITADQRQTFEQFRNLICDHIRDRFGSAMGGQSRATPEEIVDWLRQQPVDQLARQTEQRATTEGSSASQNR